MSKDLNQIVFIDTETGGIDPFKHQLLSIGMVTWTNGRIENPFEVLVDDKEYEITNEALEINHIDPYKHSLNAHNPYMAIKLLLNYCHQISPSKKILLAGHNVMFDVNFLKRFFADNDKDYFEIFSNRIIDTYSILSFLSYSGIIKSQHYNSEKAFEEFKIRIKDRHTALGDAIATAQLFNELLNISTIQINTATNK